uniref:Protein transport protein Sec31A n=1 Tax=Apteryx owenii TaxID=8824 RepID=A0A8B9PTV8_APTOW
MKLKEIDRTAMQAWSPALQHPIYLATGTSAQQLDATFSTSASLEIFELDLSDPSLDMKSYCGVFVSRRYHKLIWGPHSMTTGESVSGVLIAGGENGNIILYDPAKIIAGDAEVIIAQKDKHTGPVRALDVNIFQTNLVASGANESEIYIWDLNNFATPMTPGVKTQPLEDVSCIAWNRQVQHILASASPSGRATVWDLRKNEPIIKVSDHNNRMHCSGLAWHPDIATQMVLASEDDRLPVIQMWDLRFASSPLRVLENHTRGVLAIAWSMADPELLLSCGKDAKILCSNPNTGEVLYELPTNTQWCFDIQWCPRNPAVLSAASFDGRISVYSIMGGSADGLRQKQVDQLSSSFGNLDPFGTGQPLPPLQLPQQTASQSVILPLKKPPKWIRRPVGASFSFGGKLVTFENTKAQQQPGIDQQQQRHHVYVSQVVTEKEFLARSNQLQEAVRSEGFVSYCQNKIDMAQADFERSVWAFLKVNFEEDSRVKYLELLGYRKEDLRKKVNVLESCVKYIFANTLSSASKCFLHESKASTTREILSFKSRLKLENPDETQSCLDVDGLITQALLTGNFESAVDLCLHDNRMADAIILAIAGGQELLSRTQEKYFAKMQSKITRLITAVVTKNWKEIVQSCDLQNWREALAAVLTYARPEEFAALCDLLGNRLESEGDSLLQTQACLCYICAGNVEKLVACWTKAQDGNSPLSLQDLIEKVVILRKAVQLTQAVDPNAVGALLAEKMSQYANLLAAQGSIAAALTFLPANTNQVHDPPPFFFPVCFLSVLTGSLQAEICVEAEREMKLAPSVMKLLTESLLFSPFVAYQATQQYSFGTGGPAVYQPQQPITAPASASYPNPAPNPTHPYLPSAPSHTMPSPLYPGQPQPSPTSLNPASSFPLPPSGASFQHGRPGPPATSVAYALPTGSTGTLPATSDLPASQRTGLRLNGGRASREGRTFCLLTQGYVCVFSFHRMTWKSLICSVFQHVQALPTEKITKKPIPEEHLILKTTFEALIQRCLLSASDPQTKRKLDDANKRLEFLYDKLREQTLSPTIISGLHNIVKSIETRSYMEGLNIHTHIVSTSNFSETSAFMPVLKVVLTQANKLGV